MAVWRHWTPELADNEEANIVAIVTARPMPDDRHPEPGGWNRFVVEVEDLVSRVAEMKQAGVRFRNDVVVGLGGKQIVLEDPDGNPVELFEAAR